MKVASLSRRTALIVAGQALVVSACMFMSIPALASAAPTGTISALPVGPVSGSAVVLTGTSADPIDGIDHVDVTFSGPSAGTICGSPATPTSWSCNWNTIMLLDGTYTLTLEVTNGIAVRESPAGSISRTITVDNSPPIVALDGLTEGTNPGAQFVTGSTIYVNSNVAGSFVVGVTAFDAGVGISDVAFPSLGVNWSPSGGVDTTGPSPYTQTYSWSAGAASPGAQSATGSDNAGNTATAAFTVIGDATAPSGGAVSYVDGYTSASSRSVSFSGASDAQSGVAGAQLQRASGALVDGVCGATDVFSDIGGGNPSSPYVDATIVSGNCYQYRLRVVDNVGNVGTFASANVVKVDSSAPTGVISASPAGPSSGSPVITGTSSDGNSGVQQVDVTYSGPASGTICASPATPTAWSCSWNTGLLADGLYTISLDVTDNAGNTSSTFSRTITVDNSPPIVALDGLTEGTNPGAQFITGSTIFVNSNVAGSFDVGVTAFDAGVGISDVAFPSLGVNWSPSGGVDTTGPSPYTQTYSWSAGAASPGAQSATGSDNAGNTATAAFTVIGDATAPSGGAVSYPSSFTSSTTVDVTLTSTADAQSGVAGSQLQRASGALADGVCGAYGSFANIGGSNPSSPYTDSTLSSGVCYRYRLQVTDNVGNVASAGSSNAVKVDGGAPVALAPTVTRTSAGLVVEHVLSDSESGIDTWQIERSSAPYIAGTCGTYGAFAQIGASNAATPYTDATALPAECYRVRVLVADRAGNMAASTSTTSQGSTTTGSTGGDTLTGSTGSDVIDSGGGNDVLSSGAGNDHVDAGAGNDTANGGGGNDTIDGGAGADTLFGGQGNDNLSGGAGRDDIHGGAGSDVINGGRARDKLFGDAGNDTIRARDDTTETIRCGAGRDTAIVDRTDKVIGCEVVRRG